MLAILLNNKMSNQIYKYFCQVLYVKMQATEKAYNGKL